MLTKESKTSEKLIHLADWLDANVPPERFNFSVRGGDGDDEPPSCGTAGCASGWADEAFKGCQGYVNAWRHDGDFWEFKQENLEAWLGMDMGGKRRSGEYFGRSDFDRLFTDADRKLSSSFSEDYTGMRMSMRAVPLYKVTARIRACAAHYARMGR